MFETITLCRNRIIEVKSTELEIRKHKVDIEFNVSKYKNDEKKKEVALYLRKHKITEINNTISIIVDKKSTEVGVYPYNKPIDTKSDDNRRKLQ